MTAKSFLIDTHIILWWSQGNKLSPRITSVISDSTNPCSVSLVSLWEIIIKNQAGRLKIPKNFHTIVHSKGFSILPITEDHIQTLYKLPLIHKDPFDRLIAAQCLAENLTLITIDKNLLRYPINTLSNSSES